jgi:hypothetical protein
MAGAQGLEPWTYGFGGVKSENWQKRLARVIAFWTALIVFV